MKFIQKHSFFQRKRGQEGTRVDKRGQEKLAEKIN